MTKAILVSKTIVDENYIDHLIEENPPEDIKDLEFFRGIKTNPEMLMIYIARVSSPNQTNPSYEKLLNYCWKHSHFSVFEQVTCTMELETDLNTATQVLRHRSFVFQQLSRRYSSEGVDFVEIEARGQDPKNRQNSIENLPQEDKTWFMVAQNMVQMHSKQYYDEAISRNIAKEVARYLLPTSTKTKLYMTGNLRNFIHYVNVRTAEGVQKEHKELAEAVKKQLIVSFPVTAKAVGWV